MIINNTTLHFEGIDASKEISLYEYGLLVAHIGEGEYYCVYEISKDRFNTGYINESFLDSIAKGEEFASVVSIADFLRCNDSSLMNWLQLSVPHKLYSLLSYYGYQCIFGTCATLGMCIAETKQFIES